MWGATPIDQLMCRIEFRRLRYDGIHTPQCTDCIIGHPAFDVVSDWGGGSIEPERKIMVLNTMTMPFKFRLIPRAAGGQATPMVYVASDGHQYVVITAGGHGTLETRYGDYTIAFRLP